MTLCHNDDIKNRFVSAPGSSLYILCVQQCISVGVAVIVYLCQFKDLN